MKFGCMSCGAKYSVPDGRLEAAGPQGLRIRCSRCRAIMVVARGAPGFLTEPTPGTDGEDTKKELRLAPRRSRPATLSSDALQAEAHAEMHAAEQGVPAALSASGVYRPMPGVQRHVTGLFFPELEELSARGRPLSSRIWYAAVGGRPRGPFAATEMVQLAEKGKIRDSTLVWRPGFRTWQQVRAEGGEDLSWLKKIVRQRKLREHEAQQRAQQRLGIQPVTLTRTSSGGRLGRMADGGPGLPPPLPRDDDDEENPALTSGSFLWRAEDMPERAPTGLRRRQRSTLALLGFVALVIAVAALGLFEMKAHVVERLLHL